jgi:predicted RND superfamily exporter protein
VGLAALSILVLLAMLLRSVKLGIIAMAPNVVPILLFFGLLGAGLAPLSLPTSLIASVALGIAIDDTVHYLVRYRDEREHGLDPSAAIRITSRQVGRPMLVAALMLILGFLVVALSGFATLRQFGLLSAATMAICLGTDLVLLPALLVKTRA